MVKHAPCGLLGGVAWSPGELVGSGFPVLLYVVRGEGESAIARPGTRERGAWRIVSWKERAKVGLQMGERKRPKSFDQKLV